MSDLFNTPEVIISYPKLFEATLRKNPKPKDKPKFSAGFLFTQAAYDDPLTKAILAAVQACAVAKFGQAAFKVMLDEGKFQNPFKRDVSSKGYPEHVVRYINCDSGADYPPGVFLRDIDPATKRPKLLTDRREVYPGALVRASVTLRAYGGAGTGHDPGVKLDLRNVQKLRDGERLVGGGSSDGTEFDALPPLPVAELPDGAGPLAGMLD